MLTIFSLRNNKKLKVYSLKSLKSFPKNTKENKYFSSMKLGVSKSILDCSQKLVVEIKRIFPTLNSDWFVSCPPSYVKNNTANLLAKEIAKELNLNFIPIYQKSFHTRTHYLGLSIKEKNDFLSKVFYYKGKKLTNKKAIIIDDCFSSGIMLKNVASVLYKERVSEVYGVVYLKLSKTKISLEIPLRNFLYDTRGVDILIEILQNNDNLLISGIMLTIFQLSDIERNKLFSALTPYRKKQVIAEFKKYCKKRQLLCPI